MSYTKTRLVRIEIRLIPREIPYFISYEVYEGDTKVVDNIPISSLTFEQASKYADLLRHTFLGYYRKNVTQKGTKQLKK